MVIIPVVTYYPIAMPEDWIANVPPLPEISSPASSHQTSSSGGVSLFEKPPVAQLHSARCISVGSQINWDSKTGQPLGNMRAKRRPSVEERASRQQIRRRGGSCASCKASHRKVIILDYLSPFICANTKPLSVLPHMVFLDLALDPSLVCGLVKHSSQWES